jgi:hypothetical protein
VTKHRDRGPRTACCASSHSYWGFGGGEFRTRGTRFSEFPAESSRWDPRRAHRPRLLVEGPPSDWEGKHSRNFRRCRPASSIRFPTTMNCSYGIRLATDNRPMST